MILNGTPLQYEPVVLADFAASGVLGTAATTVDVSSLLIIPQTTAGVVLTIPAPTAGVAADGQVLKIVNSSTTVALSIEATVGFPTVAMMPTTSADFIWTGTNWVVVSGVQSGRYGFLFTAVSVTLGPLNYMVSCGNGASAITITFPPANLNGGRKYIVKRFSGSTGTVTISGGGTNIQALNGTFASTTTLAALNAYGQHVQFMSDGTVWVRVS